MATPAEFGGGWLELDEFFNAALAWLKNLPSGIHQPSEPNLLLLRTA
ncbi:MAG: hypothetical protein AAF518_02270 [Spirochaetota bacterium]